MSNTAVTDPDAVSYGLILHCSKKAIEDIKAALRNGDSLKPIADKYKIPEPLRDDIEGAARFILKHN